eukprot:TRINITY_DN171_c0_g2_i1.p1 TRINITY_DN171_c0_g2~~TRINITY_DN171_c0_g2_i1.p1  ORF type:complete len:311 (-),score=123.47 TRINITY_DN171_c0_g2_i1:114-1046(-)
MASLRNAAKRKTHKERGQISSRKKYGLLEKKKDYKLRAQDYHSKQNRLNILKQKALFRNPDEFYHRMINSKTVGGIHKEERKNVNFTAEEMKLLRSQDLKYVQTVYQANRKRLEKLKADLHFVEQSDIDSENEEEEDEEEIDYSKYLYDSDEELDNNDYSDEEDHSDDDDDDDDLEDEIETDNIKVKRLNTHIIFVDDEDELNNFSATKYFNTTEDTLINNPHKTLTVDQIKQNKEKKISKAQLKINRKLKKKKEKKINEYKQLRDRNKSILKVKKEMQTQRNLLAKGKRVKITKKDGTSYYKWKNIRKK